MREWDIISLLSTPELCDAHCWLHYGNKLIHLIVKKRSCELLGNSATM